MQTWDKKRQGFGIVEVIIGLAIMSAVGALAWYGLSGSKKSDSKSESASTSNAISPEVAQSFIWQQTESGWQANGTPPTCGAQPLLKMPADLSKVTSVLYPGQTRGGNYKPHGGFRFDTSPDNKITVTAPMEGYLIRGSGYIAEGEIQYGLDVMNNCGIMYRIGHIRELPENLQKIADKWPKPTESSVTHRVSPEVVIKQGDVLGTKVGILASKNTFFDLGVYDFREQNPVSKTAAFQSVHSQNKELSWHAVCWLKDWLPSGDQQTLSKLPSGDPASGKSSDYCK